MDLNDPTELSADEVDTLMSDIQRQMEQHSVSPTVGRVGDGDQPALSSSTVFARSREVTSNHSSEQNVGSSPLLPAFLAEHNVAEALRRANLLHMQRVGYPAVLSTRFDPALVSGGGAAFEETSTRLNALDFHPSLGPERIVTGCYGFRTREVITLPICTRYYHRDSYQT